MHYSVQGLLNLGCQVLVGLCHFFESTSIVESLGTGRCPQILQGNLVDVVVGMERPELVPAFPVPIEEPREGGHWCLDQIIQ